MCSMRALATQARTGGIAHSTAQQPGDPTHLVVSPRVGYDTIRPRTPIRGDLQDIKEYPNDVGGEPPGR